MASTILLCLTLGYLPALQEQTTATFIGIPDKDFEAHHRSLDEPNWYWAASVQMVLAYYQQKVTQKELMAPANDGDHPLDITASPKKLDSYSNGMVKDESGKRLMLSSLQASGSKMSVVYNHLKRQQPLVLLTTYKKEVFAFVLTGADVELGTPEEKKFIIKSLHIWTPYDFKTVQDWKGTRLEKDPNARKRVLQVKKGERATELFFQGKYSGDFSGVSLVLCEKMGE